MLCGCGLVLLETLCLQIFVGHINYRTCVCYGDHVINVMVSAMSLLGIVLAMGFFLPVT